MTQEEWFKRYRQRLVDVAGVSDADAEDIADTGRFEELSEFFEDDPEGAADEEMSCWDAD